MHVSAPRPLDVNITKALYLRLLAVATQAAAAARAPRAPPPRRAPASDLLVLRNTTGVDIEFLLVGAPSRAAPAQRVRLAPDEQRALLHSQRQRRGLLSLPSLRGVSVSVFVPGYQPLVGLELHRVHARLISLAPLVPMGASDLKLRYAVHLDGAARVAELAGAVSVLNSAPVAIQLSDQAQRWTCLMQPGTRRALPIVVSTALRLRPSPERATYEWSDLLSLPQQPGSRHEALAAALPTAAHRDPVLAVALSAEHTEGGLLSVEVRAPLVLENLTAAALHFRLSAHGEHKCGGRVAAGAEEAVLTVGEWESIEEAALALEMHLTGWEPARLPLRPPADGKEERVTISMLDQHDRPLLLEVSVAMGQGATMRVSVWSKFVLYNRTRLPLLFRQFRRSADLVPGRAHKLAAGQVRDDSDEEGSLPPDEDSAEAEGERDRHRKRVAEVHRQVQLPAPVCACVGYRCMCVHECV